MWLLLAPLLPGIINKVKAWVAGRRGPPVLQLYYDLAKLWRKGVVLSTLASPGFVAGPAVAWVALTGAAMLMPLGPAGSALSFRGDVLLLIYLLALARFCTAWAAMETGSAFEGMGAAREVSYAVLAEAAIIAAVLSLSVQTGSVSLVTMLVALGGRGRGAAGGGLVHRAAGGELPRAVRRSEHASRADDDPRGHGARSQRSAARRDSARRVDEAAALRRAADRGGAADGRTDAARRGGRAGGGRADGDGRRRAWSNRCWRGSRFAACRCCSRRHFCCVCSRCWWRGKAVRHE